MLLPPGWRDLKGRPLQEIAAAQWEITNRTALADLRNLPAERWMSLRYADLVANPRDAVASICRFADLAFDAALEQSSLGSVADIQTYPDGAGAGQMAAQRGSRAQRVAGSRGDVAELEALDAALASLRTGA